MSFESWLHAQRDRDDRVGELARDVTADPDQAARSVAAARWPLDEVPSNANVQAALSQAEQEWEAAGRP